MKNMWDIVLNNYLDIYLYEDWTKKSDDEKIIEDFEEFKNRKISEKETIKKKLEIIEEKIKIILSDEKSKKAREIKNKLMFMIACASKYLSFDIFNNSNFLVKDFDDVEIRDEFLNIKNDFKEMKIDFFGNLSANKSKYYEIFVNENLDVKTFNKEFLISKFIIKSDLIHINNEKVNDFFSYIFKNIYWLRSFLKGGELSSDASITVALISLLIINGYFSNFIFSKINNEYRNYFEIEENQLRIINDIKNKFIRKSRDYKNKYNINIFSDYDQEKFSNIIIEFEKQFNITEYKDLLDKKNENFRLSQSKNKYAKFFYNWSSLFFKIENYLIDESKILKRYGKNNNKLSFNESWKINLENKIYEELSLEIEKINKCLNGNRHAGIYLSDLIDNENVNFIDIYEKVMNFLINFRNNLKKINVNEWIFIDENYVYEKKKNGEEKKEKSDVELKSMHKGFVISNLNRLIKNVNQTLINQSEDKTLFKIKEEKSDIEKKLTIFSSGNVNENFNDRKDRFNKIKEKIDFNKNLLEKVNYFENEISNLKQEKRKDFFIDNLHKKINANSSDQSYSFKFVNDNNSKIQYIKTITVNNIFEKKEELFDSIINNKIKNINREELFLYYKNVLNKNLLNENNFSFDDLEKLINKNTIRRNIKYFIYDNNTIEKAKYNKKNKEIDSIVHSFFTKIIKQKLLKYGTKNDYKNSLIKDYEKLGLNINNENPNLEIYDELQKKIKPNILKTEIIDQLENSYKSLLNKLQGPKVDRNIIFYTYIKKYIINLTSERLFKASIINALKSTKGIARSRIENIFPILNNGVLKINTENNQEKFEFDSKKLNYQKIKNNSLTILTKEIQDSNSLLEKNGLLLNSFGKIEDFTIVYKIKSDVLILEDYIKPQDFFHPSNKSEMLRLESSKIYNFTKFLRDRKLMEKYPLIYKELDNYKKPKNKKILVRNIIIKSKSYRVFIEYSYIKKIHEKINDEEIKLILIEKNTNKISLNFEEYIWINSPILFKKLRDISNDKLNIAKLKNHKKENFDLQKQNILKKSKKINIF